MVTFVSGTGEDCLEREIVTAAVAAAKARTCGILMFGTYVGTGILYLHWQHYPAFITPFRKKEIRFDFLRYIVSRGYPTGINLIVD